MDGKGAKRRHSDAETSGQFGAVDKVYIKDSPYDKIDIKGHGGHTYDDEF